MEVTFAVRGRTYCVPEPQAAILAENLRILATTEASRDHAGAVPPSYEWRNAALTLANRIEDALVVQVGGPLEIEGIASDPASKVLRVMVGIDSSATAGLRDALGTRLEERIPTWRRHRSFHPAASARHLSRSQLVELLSILFVLAVVTVVAGVAWTGLWYVTAPVIAALLGARVATMNSTDKAAWSVASIVWWAIMLVPAAALVIVLGLLVADVF